jgi:hypothetical protein
MKQTPQEQAVVARMAPGVLSREGFLGDDARSLAEIVEADRAALEAKNLTPQRLAERMEDVLRAAMGAMGGEVPAGPGWTAQFHEAMGRIACPWGGCGVFAKGEVELIEVAGVAEMHFGALSVHLVAEHGFFQGRGSRYRLEPALLARAMGLA